MRREPWEWRVADLRCLIRDQVAEDAYLEYKAGDALARTDRAKNEISKDVSAFANGGGGTYVYGIREQDHIPMSLDGVDERAVDREWLEQVIVSRIQPRIEGIRIRPIRIRKGKVAGKVAYVVWIPQSERGPHQAADKRFYARRNFTVQPMEEYEVRDVHQRRRSPEITVNFFFRRHGARIDRFPIDWSNPETLHHLELNAEIQNEGGGAVPEALVTVIFDERLLADLAHLPFSSRDLTLEIQNNPKHVKYTQIPWRGPRGMSLFKSVAYRLLENDLPIAFRKDWVENDPPFIYWEVRAPDMAPRSGYLEIRRAEGDVRLAAAEPPEIGEYAQDGRGRPFLSHPDLSVSPTSPGG